MSDSTIASGNILVRSGLNFEVEKRPHYVRSVTRDGDVFTESAMSSGIFRTDTGDEIGDVKHTYEIAQTDEILRPFLMAAQEGYLQYKSGRAIDNGRRFCLTFDTGSTRVHGEEITKRIIVGGSHDGSWATFIKTLVYRQICSNGLMGFAADNQFRIKHTRNWKTRYDEVLQTLERTERFFVEAFAKYNDLFDVHLTREIRALLTKRLLDIKDDEKTSTRKQNQFHKIMWLSERGKGIAGNPEIQNTGAAWFNAVAEYVDHYSNRSNEETRYVSAFFGSGETRKEKAFQLVSAV